VSADTVSRAWSWRKAVTRSGLMPTTRHVLLTLSLHMNEHGEGCYPPVEDLVEETGLSKRAVLEHLSKAIEAGWLVRQELGLRGRRWRRSEYQPSWPGRDVDVDMGDISDMSEMSGASARGDDGRSPPPPGGVVTQDARGGDPNGSEVVTDGHRVGEESIQESSRSPKIEREARAREQDPDPRPWERDKHFSTLIERYPGIHSPNLAWPAWQRLDDEGRRRALSRLDAYLAERRKVRNETVFALQNYLGQRLFDQAPEPEAGQPVMTLAKGRSKEFWWLLQRKAERGEKIKFAFELSRDHGSGMSISIAETREFEQAGVMHEIETGGEAFEAWRRWFESRGIRFRSTDTHICGKFIYVPSEWPPGWAHGPPQAEGERAEELETAESGEDG
jgi:hypothetical protein